MEEIKLSQQGKNKGKYIALVDDEDYEYLNQFKWCAVKNSNNDKIYYAIRTIYNPCQKNISMHRLIMNTSKGKDVDHINHNGLDNQKENMRNCNRSQNIANKTATGKSKYLGVYIDRGKYIIAQIFRNKKRYYLGIFKNELEAAKAYDIKAKELFGEFANLNFKL